MRPGHTVGVPDSHQSDSNKMANGGNEEQAVEDNHNQGNKPAVLLEQRLREHIDKRFDQLLAHVDNKFDELKQEICLLLKNQ